MTRRSMLTLIAAGLAALSLAAPAPAQEHAPTSAPPPAAGAGHAAGHEEVGVLPSVKQGLVVSAASVVVFGIVFVILATTVWPRITKGLADRENKIREEIESAERARQQAREALAQYEKSLAEARAEAQRMLEATKASQQALAAELRAKADAELAAMRERARRDIEAAKRAALTEIHHAGVELAVAAAGKILRREVQPGDTRRLIDESLGEFQGVKS